MKNFPMPKSKYWKKVEEYDAILSGYERLCEKYELDYSESDIFTYIPRLETDKYDEWVGVEPKRFRKNEDLIILWEDILNSLYLSYKTFGNSYLFRNYLDQDDRNKINWDMFIKSETDLIISPLLNYKKVDYKKEETIEIQKFLIKNIDFLKYLAFYTEDNTTISIDSLSKLIEDCDFEVNYNMLPPKMLWEYKFNFIPKNKNIETIINPFYFNPKQWKSIVSMIENKGIDFNSYEKEICHMFNVFKGNISQIINQVKDLENLLNYDFNLIEYNLDENEFLKMYNSNKNVSEVVSLLIIIKKENLNIEINTYKITKSKIMEIFYINQDLDENFVKEVSKYIRLSDRIEDMYQNANVLNTYYSYFNRYKNNKCLLPNLTGSYQNNKSEYTWEITTKDNPLNMILGEATDCCQHIGGNGEACLKYGLSKKNSTFFIVKRNDRIIAQSWIWMNQKEKTICFDSIEILGNDTYSENVIKLYLEVASQLKEQFDDYTIIAGADGNRLPFNISELGDYISINNDDYLFELPSDYKDYSDAVEEQYIIC